MANGKDSRGRFAKGNQYGSRSNGGGRPTDETRAALHATIDANVSAEAVAAAWKRVEKVLLTGGPGWKAFFELYLDRRYGKPDTYQSVDVDGDMTIRVEYVKATVDD